MAKTQDFEMYPAGTINSEESYAGITTDGRAIVVEEVIYAAAPAGERDDSRYWENLYNLGVFEDGENYPPVWVR